MICLKKNVEKYKMLITLLSLFYSRQQWPSPQKQDMKTITEWREWKCDTSYDPDYLLFLTYVFFTVVYCYGIRGVADWFLIVLLGNAHFIESRDILSLSHESRCIYTLRPYQLVLGATISITYLRPVWYIFLTVVFSCCAGVLEMQSFISEHNKKEEKNES
jgi:hypothetical protein